jgi:hypothetical protein
MTTSWLKRAVLLITFLLAACGAPPTIRDSQVMAPVAAKTTSLQFIYRNVEMTQTSSIWGKGAAVANTGFSGFGALLVKQAPAAFAPHGVAVVESKELDGKQPIITAGAPQGAGGTALPILAVTPISGRTSSNGKSTSTSYVFSAQLIDPASRRLIWKATIDTSTWSGQDIVMKHVEKTLYDDAYAAQLLKAVTTQLKQDGVI